MMILDIIINIICSFVGTVAFSILFCVPKRYYLWCGITGIAGWMLYLLLINFSSELVANFFGTVIVVLMARILAVYKRCPITIFLIPGIFPLIPGSSVYYTVYYLVTEQISESLNAAGRALTIAFAIVLGIVCVVSIPKKHFVFKKSK